MILSFIGAIIILIYLCGSGVSVGVLIAGIVVFLLGVCSMDYNNERLTARMNRQKYWAHYYDKEKR